MSPPVEPHQFLSKIQRMSLIINESLVKNIKRFFNHFFRFLVPYNPPGEGYCAGSILKLYFAKINEAFEENIIEGPLFYQGTGKPGTKDKISKFLGKKNVIGKSTLAEIGKEVAKFLNLEHPEKYTGHCFR